MRTRALLASAIVLLAAGTAGCAAADGTGPDAPPATSQSQEPSSAPASPEGGEEAGAEEVVITISDFAFAVPESIPPGAEVTVVNEDSSYHTVTADDGAFDVGARQGEPVTFTAPEEPGEYPFHCTPHPNMTATLVVG